LRLRSQTNQNHLALDAPELGTFFLLTSWKFLIRILKGPQCHPKSHLPYIRYARALKILLVDVYV
jgi:hypothetical protein